MFDVSGSPPPLPPRDSLNFQSVPASDDKHMTPGGAPRALSEFVVVYEQHYHRVASFVYRRLSDRHATEEVTGEVFLTAFRSRHQFRGDAPIASWLLGIAAHLISRRVRRRRLEQRLLRMIGRACTRSVMPDATIEASDELRRVRAAIDELPAGQQAVISLHCIEGVPLNETAIALGIAEGTAKSRLSRARDRLRKHLYPNGVGK